MIISQKSYLQKKIDTMMQNDLDNEQTKQQEVDNKKSQRGVGSKKQMAERNVLYESKFLQKAKKEAEISKFTCLLVYFSTTAVFLMILYFYSNIMFPLIVPTFSYFFLLILNTYLMLVAGKNPGFLPQNLPSQNQSLLSGLSYKYCTICSTPSPNRSKHCFYCGRCVRKYDHHCPWIGSCVGEQNHCIFWCSLLTHSLLAAFSTYICYFTLDIYHYKNQAGYQPEYGVFCLFTILMLIYFLFASGLLLFHTVLILFNITTQEITERDRLKYLNGIKGNPFYHGMWNHLKEACSQNINEWQIVQTQKQEQDSNCFNKVCNNQYFNCC